MVVFAASGQTVGLIIGLILGFIALAAALILLYIFVFSRQRMKKQIRDLEKKYSYLDALLIGQDSQYIHRLEIISRSNLLYVEKHESFSRQFKEIYENDDKFAESMIKQLNALVKNKQYKILKPVILQGKKAVQTFEEKVNSLDERLYALIKPEEDIRPQILKLKETYRRLKQSFFSNSNDLDLVSGSLIKVFDKLDLSFTEFENLIESAEYDEATNMIPKVQKVVNAIENALVELPNLCVLTTSIVPEKIVNLTKEFNDVEKQGLPLYNLSFTTKSNEWKDTLEKIKVKLANLQYAGVADILDRIQKEIEELRTLLKKEVSDKEFFVKNVETIYGKAIELEKSFLKICSFLPEVKSVYKIGDDQEKDIQNLKEMMEKVGDYKRALDNYVHSNTKQPFSILKNKLDELSETYDKAYKGMLDFKAYLEAIKTSSEEAYDLVFVYFYRCKQIESLLREINIEELNEIYRPRIESTYETINTIDILVKKKPIDVLEVNQRVEELKNNANSLFDEIEDKYRQMQLAESAVVYANRDRAHQSDVDQQLNQLETEFAAGQFETVYREATNIYRKNHAEETDDGGR